MLGRTQGVVLGVIQHHVQVMVDWVHVVTRVITYHITYFFHHDFFFLTSNLLIPPTLEKNWKAEENIKRFTIDPSENKRHYINTHMYEDTPTCVWSGSAMLVAFCVGPVVLISSAQVTLSKHSCLQRKVMKCVGRVALERFYFWSCVVFCGGNWKCKIKGLGWLPRCWLNM